MDASTRPIFQQLRALLEASREDAAQLSCVQLALESGATFDVYRAREVNPAMPVWHVRGFYVSDQAPPVERRALLLGTQDGRAMLTDGGLLDDQSADRSELVTEASPTTRSLDELSAVIASAVRRLMAESLT